MGSRNGAAEEEVHLRVISPRFQALLGNAASLVQIVQVCLEDERGADGTPLLQQLA